ncbi:MAG: RNA methyltransferase [Clostridia bacterium]|jgi:TrmH family RNA methyltransferase|nr:RNA methyltransferase [Clostridia bacterium]
MQVITSKDNETIKNIRKLKEKKYRDSTNKYIIEGIKLIQEAIEEKALIDTIVICEDCVQQKQIEAKVLYEIAKFNCIYVSSKIFDLITEVTNPQGILAIIDRGESKKELDYTKDIILVLEDIQDPGNLGTILRTADSVGLNQILISKKTADVYNSKVIRSTMGAIFRINIVQTEDLEKNLKEIKKHKFKVMVTSLQAEEDIYEVDYTKKVIVIGNEAKGVSQQILKLADNKIKIPMIGKTESLNVAVATSIILYEYVRQKRGK